MWSNKEYKLCAGHYEMIKSKAFGWTREFQIVALVPGKRPKTFKFSSPRAAKKAGWIYAASK